MAGSRLPQSKFPYSAAEQDTRSEQRILGDAQVGDVVTVVAGASYKSIHSLNIVSAGHKI
jgi:hypothetical protein